MFLPGWMMTCVSPIFLIFAESRAHSFSQTSVAMRPARRSVTMPGVERGEIRRAQTSPGFNSTPRPSASMTRGQLGIPAGRSRTGEVAGSAARRDAGRDGNHAPCAEFFASASRFGVAAASSGVR